MAKIVTNEDIYCLLTEVSKSNKSIKKELGIIKEDFNHKLEYLKIKNTELEGEVKQLRSRLHRAEKNIKKYNTVVYGVKETENVPGTILNILNDLLNMQCNITDFRDIFKIGKMQQGKIRPTILEVVNYNLKVEILRKAKSKTSILKNKGIYIKNDLTTDEYEDRKILVHNLKSARAKNLKAKIIRDKLIVGGEYYTVDQLKRNSDNIVQDVDWVQNNLEDNTGQQINVTEAKKISTKTIEALLQPTDNEKANHQNQPGANDTQIMKPKVRTRQDLRRRLASGST